MRVCVRVCVCILTVCLGIGGSPDGLFVSASSFRMWSVLMYESYRPSPWRAAGTMMNKVNQCDDVRLLNLQQKHRTILEGDVNRMQFNFLHWDALSLFDQIRQCPINHLTNHTSSSSYPDAKTNCIVQLDKSLEPPQQDILHYTDLCMPVGMNTVSQNRLAHSCSEKTTIIRYITVAIVPNTLCLRPALQPDQLTHGLGSQIASAASGIIGLMGVTDASVTTASFRLPICPFSPNHVVHTPGVFGIRANIEGCLCLSFNSAVFHAHLFGIEPNT